MRLTFCCPEMQKNQSARSQLGIYIYIYIYVYICIYLYMYIWMYGYMDILIYGYMDIFIYVCICVYVYVCIYVYMYICYICIYLFSRPFLGKGCIRNIDQMYPEYSHNAQRFHSLRSFQRIPLGILWCFGMMVPNRYRHSKVFNEFSRVFLLFWTCDFHTVFHTAQFSLNSFIILWCF